MLFNTKISWSQLLLFHEKPKVNNIIVIYVINDIIVLYIDIIYDTPNSKN